MTSDVRPLTTAALLDYPASQTYLGGVSRSTLKSLTGNGQLHVIRIGRRTMFSREELDAFIARRRNAE